MQLVQKAAILAADASLLIVAGGCLALVLYMIGN
jgi:hypothetical protein